MLNTMQKTVELGDIRIGNKLPFVLIAGPCQIEGLDHALSCAGRLAEIAAASSDKVPT